MEAKTDDVNARINQLRTQVRELDKPYRDRLLPAKYAKFPQNMQDAIATPEEKRTPGQMLLADQVIRACRYRSGEIDRISSRKISPTRKSCQAEIARIEKEMPEAYSGGRGHYRWRLPFHAGRSGRRACAGQG